MVNGWLVPIAPRGKPDWTLCVPVDSVLTLVGAQPANHASGRAGGRSG